MSAADPSSDWNAPVEHWGNYEEPPELMAAASLLKDQAALIKVFMILALACSISMYS